MTEFEQQVAAGLALAFGPVTCVVYRDGVEVPFSIAEHLAPRVAAAGTLLAQELAEDAVGERGNPTDAAEIERVATRYRQDFVAALRGDSLGATGRFPDGQLGPDDEGELRFAVGHDKARRLVTVEFGKRVAWLAIPPATALEMAGALRNHAAVVQA